MERLKYFSSQPPIFMFILIWCGRRSWCNVHINLVQLIAPSEKRFLCSKHRPSAELNVQQYGWESPAIRGVGSFSYNGQLMCFLVISGGYLAMIQLSFPTF